VSQIANNLWYERAWNLGKKKEGDEGISFYLLLALGMYHGGRNLVGKEGDGGLLHGWRAEAHC